MLVGRFEGEGDDSLGDLDGAVLGTELSDGTAEESFLLGDTEENELGADDSEDGTIDGLAVGGKEDIPVGRLEGEGDDSLGDFDGAVLDIELSVGLSLDVELGKKLRDGLPLIFLLGDIEGNELGSPLGRLDSLIDGSLDGIILD